MKTMSIYNHNNYYSNNLTLLITWKGLGNVTRLFSTRRCFQKVIIVVGESK